MNNVLPRRSQLGFTSPLVILLLFALLAVAITLTYSRINDATAMCGGLGQKVLDSDKANYSLHRCELEEFTADDGTTITRVYAVAGEVEKRWEFECGFVETQCSRHIGWFDDDEKLFDFVDQPLNVNRDPAALALGCSLRNVGVNDGDLTPALVVRNEQYYWQIDYDNYETVDNSLDRPGCRLNGVSFVNNDLAEADVTATYLFNPGECKFENNHKEHCRIASTVLNGGYEDCRYDFSQTIDEVESHLGVNCGESYYSRTGDDSICGLETDFAGQLDCSRVLVINGTLVGKLQ